MSYIINNNHSLLLVISRFDLSLGFGDKTVKEVCEANGIDAGSFLAVVNFLSEEKHDPSNTYEWVELGSIIRYLKNAHSYFLDYKLPSIRSKLLQVVDSSPENNTPFREIFLKFFDDYYTEVRKHMDYENNTVFPYAVQLFNGKRNPEYSISIFEQKHDQIDLKMIELKNILLKYYPSKGSDHLLTEVLFDIYACEKDLASHNNVEDLLFVPAVKTLEQKITQATL
jgi:regulator of cell morphogenesis and NO signaling